MTWWSNVTWDVARAGGITAYVLLTLSVALGLTLSLRWQRPRWPRLITNELHNFVTELSLVFIAVHGAAVWLDPYMRFGWREVLIPLASHYRPLWMGLGIVALYLMLAIWISTQLRPRIGYSWWRRLHTLTFAVYVLATIHGIGTGSDTRSAWALGLYAGSVLLVGALLTMRLLTPVGARGRSHPRLAALAALAAVVGALWTATGPAQAGWNAVANNGQGSGSRVAPTTVQQPAPAARGATTLSPFSAPLQGTVVQDGPDASGAVTVRFTMSLGDGTGRTLDIAVQGTPGDDGGLAVTATRVTLSAGAGNAAYTGSLTALNGGRWWRMAARLGEVGNAAQQMDVSILLRMTADQQVSGTMQSAPVAAGSTEAPGSAGTAGSAGSAGTTDSTGATE